MLFSSLLLVLPALVLARPLHISDDLDSIHRRAGNTGLSSVLDNPGLTKSRSEVTTGLNGIEKSLTTLATQFSSDAAAMQLITSAQDGRTQAKTAVNDIATNILANEAPNKNGGQAEVVKGLQAINSSITDLGPIVANNGAATQAFVDLTNNFTLASKAGLAVLASANTTIDAVLNNNGTKPAAAPASDGGTLDKVVDAAGKVAGDTIGLDGASKIASGVTSVVNGIKNKIKGLFGRV